MAMLITKFNKLIANKFVWIGFTVLIVLAFVAWDMSVPDDARDPAARLAPGTLYGQPVPPDEFHGARIHAYMSLILSMGRQIPISPEIDRELNRMAWRHLITMRRGREWGLVSSNREVIEAIRAYPGFQHEGQFHPDIYRGFIDHLLAPMGFTPAQFEEYVRQELLVQKLERMVSEAVLVAPSEVDRAIQSIGDEFVVHYALIDERILGEGLDVTEDDARAYFEANLERFMIPPKVRVKYIRFPVADYLVEAEITEQQALDYYDLHIDEFVRVPEDADLEEDELFQVTETIPFEEVREDIMDRLRRDVAARRAADSAMDFVIKLVPDRHGEASGFEEAAEQFGKSVEYTEPFAEGDVPPEIDAGPAFSRAAFELRPHPEYFFSDAIEGRENIYVMALVERIPEREPSFEEISARAMVAAFRDAAERAVTELANQFHAAAEEAIAAGNAFREIAESFAVPVRETPAFTAATGLEETPYGNELVRTVLGYNEGEVTAPVATRAGRLVAFISQRTPVDPAEFAHLRPQIVASLTRDRARILFHEWQEQLLREAEFQPRTIEQPLYDEEDDFYDDYAGR